MTTNGPTASSQVARQGGPASCSFPAPASQLSYQLSAVQKLDDYMQIREAAEFLAGEEVEAAHASIMR